MLSRQQIDAANEYGNKIQRAVHECVLPSTHRVRAAGGCFAVALDHHHAITVLNEVGLYASAFALVRVIFEAYVRGEWLAKCADEPQIASFISGGEPPTIRLQLSAIEATEPFDGGTLSQIRQKTWSSMCEYTHTGGLQIQRWATPDGIESAYQIEEVLEVQHFADIFAALSAIGLLTLADDADAAEEVFGIFAKRIE